MCITGPLMPTASSARAIFEDSIPSCILSYSFSQSSGTAASTDGFRSLMSRETVLSDSTNRDSPPT